MSGNKVPRPEIAMSPGVPLAPRAELLAWLDAQAEKLVRVPLVLVRGDVGLRGARIGELEVQTQDMALGMGLADRARSLLGDAAEGAVWADGYWHSLHGDHFQFDVVHVGAVLTPAELATATTFVRLEDS
jgi:hypothetical protein